MFEWAPGAGSPAGSRRKALPQLSLPRALPFSLPAAVPRLACGGPGWVSPGSGGGAGPAPARGPAAPSPPGPRAARGRRRGADRPGGPAWGCGQSPGSGLRRKVAVQIAVRYGPGVEYCGGVSSGTPAASCVSSDNEDVRNKWPKHDNEVNLYGEFLSFPPILTRLRVVD